MPTNQSRAIKTLILIVGAALFAALFFYFYPEINKEVIVKLKQVVVPVPKDGKTVLIMGWREDFSSVSDVDRTPIPKGWKIVNKPGTRPTVFTVEAGADTRDHFLHMASERSSASLITFADGVDLKRTPVLRWRWRVTELPRGADGRLKGKDDQAIGIYVGSGTTFNNMSISYRWDTQTPKGSEGSSVYGLGTVKVKWYTLRNSEDAKHGEWLEEERNIAEDFKKAWGFYPEKIYLSVSSNSQYTNTRAAADLCWIDFVSLSGG